MFNLTNTAKIVVPALALLATAVSFSSHASVTPDRTRLVFNESDKSISVTLRNNDPTLPYLAQSWIEDAKGNKISSPLAVLPPVQRIDAMMNGQDFTVNNPTPYYVIISNASAKKGGNPPAGFTPLMMEPKTSAPLNAKMDSVPVLTYINDYGARMPLYFICTGNSCQVDEEQSRKG